MRLARELRENTEGAFSGATGTFCTHRHVGEIVLLHHGLIVTTRRTCCRTERIARRRFEGYLAELSRDHGSKAVRITTVFSDGTTAVRMTEFSPPAEGRPRDSHL